MNISNSWVSGKFKGLRNTVRSWVRNQEVLETPANTIDYPDRPQTLFSRLSPLLNKINRMFQHGMIISQELKYHASLVLYQEQVSSRVSIHATQEAVG